MIQWGATTEQEKDGLSFNHLLNQAFAFTKYILQQIVLHTIHEQVNFLKSSLCAFYILLYILILQNTFTTIVKFGEVF